MPEEIKAVSKQEKATADNAPAAGEVQEAVPEEIAAVPVVEEENTAAGIFAEEENAPAEAPDPMEFNAFSALPEMSDFEKQAREMRSFREATEKKIGDIDEEFRRLRSAVISYKEDVYNTLYEPFLTKFAELMQDMEQCKDGFALRLEYIIKSMGMQPVSPEPGDAFSYDMHKRERCDSTGMTVRKCIVRGWKLGNKLLAAAVVTTD